MRRPLRAVASAVARRLSGSGALAIVVPAAAAALPYALACPPFDLSLLAWLAPALLLVPARRLGPARAALCGLAFGVLIGAAITHWALGASLEYFAFDRLSAAVFVLLVWVVCSGVPYALLAAAYAVVARRLPRTLLPLAGAWLWVACEMLRANPWVGLPWELLVHTQWRSLRLVQIADLGGMYAVSFVMVLVSLTAGELLAERAAARAVNDAGRAGARGMRLGERAPLGGVRRLAVPLALLAAVLLYGEDARRTQATARAAEATRRVAIVQSSVPAPFRWKRAYVERVLASYARLTDEATGGTPVDLVVWPENAVGFYLDAEPLLRTQMGAVAARSGGALLVGAPRLGDARAAYNSVYLLDAAGDVRATYDKRRLLPFAEYDPLARAAPGDAELRYAPGTGDGMVPAADLRLGVVICYEAIFPSLLRSAVAGGAEVLVNLSNDAWLDAGDGAAPSQHLSMAVFRAIENRRFLLRAASSGVSAVVSPYGEPIAMLPVGASRGAIAEIAPRTGRTLYNRFGELWMVPLGLVVLAALLVGRRGDTA